MTGPLDRRSFVGAVAGLGLAMTLGGARPRRRITMETRTVPSTGERLPVIGMGTWQTFDVGADPETRRGLAEVLGALVAAGGTVVDSSPMYGRSEAVLGELARERELERRLFVATKVWTTGRDAGIRQMERSVELLGNRTAPSGARGVDLIQVHNLVDLETQLATLRAWKDAGRIRYLGVTHYQASAHDEVAAVVRRHPIDFVQINYSVNDRGAERSLLPLLADRGVAVLINRPFGGGGLFSRVRGRPFPPWAGELGIASWAQLFLKFVISHPAVTVAIPATSRLDHLRDNLLAGSGPMPDDASRRRIAALFD
ncbi:MAG: aldo/keto reductase [Gemmatimonadales bacterium]